MKKEEVKLFAFKVAEKNKPAKSEAKWAVREGVATAGCTAPWYRYNSAHSKDGGVWC